MAATTRADYVGLDFDPDDAGCVGQLINFGRNEDDHFQCATDFDALHRRSELRFPKPRKATER